MKLLLVSTILLVLQCQLNAQTSLPKLHLEWEYNKDGDIYIDEPHGFIVKIGPFSPINTEDKFPTTRMFIRESQLQNPLVVTYGGAYPFIATAALPPQMPYTSRIFYGELPYGNYVSVVTAFMYEEDGTIIEGPPSEMIGISSLGVEVIQADSPYANKEDWEIIKTLQIIRTENRKFFHLRFKEGAGYDQ